jgi:large subunit ribosomal protein L31
VSTPRLFPDCSRRNLAGDHFLTESVMKEKIHPKYVESTITCSCGNTWKTRSTRESVHLDICSNCHPYFTGEQRIVDTAGRVERFLKRYGMNQPS